MRPADIPWNATGGPFVASTDGGKLAPERQLHVRWLGTAGYELRYGGHTLLIDPYITRIPLFPFLLRRRWSPDVTRIQNWISDANAVLVGHSHFDHVMDVPTIAQLTGAHVYGSRSTANLCQAAGLEEAQVTAVDERGQTFEVGSFRVQAVPSEHSRFLFGRVPYPGEIPCTCDLPLAGHHYRCGQVLSWLISAGNVRLYHAGSANLIDDAVKLRDIDVLMMCTAGRQATDAFVPRIIAQTQPRRVLPMHYDNFFRPLDAPLKLLPRTQLSQLVDDIANVDRNAEVGTLELGKTVILDAG